MERGNEAKDGLSDVRGTGAARHADQLARIPEGRIGPEENREAEEAAESARRESPDIEPTMERLAARPDDEHKRGRRGVE
jgi:hypothetical protein